MDPEVQPTGEEVRHAFRMIKTLHNQVQCFFTSHFDSLLALANHALPPTPEEAAAEWAKVNRGPGTYSLTALVAHLMSRRDRLNHPIASAILHVRDSAAGVDRCVKNHTTPVAPARALLDSVNYLLLELDTFMLDWS